MRRTVVGLLALLACGAVAAAGPMVRWDRIDGATADSTCVGGNVSAVFLCPGRQRTVGGGRVMLNLQTGFLSFAIETMATAGHYANAPLGSLTTPSRYVGTVVCDSTERFGVMQYVDTPPVVLIEGSGSFRGFLDLPEGCLARPAEIVFLLRHFEPGAGFDGLFSAYGAGRTIQ